MGFIDRPLRPWHLVPGHALPPRCDLSPGGRWPCYFALKYGSEWPAGPTYNAVSRLPWLHPLAAWREYGTWSRGFHFVADPGVWEVGEPAVGNATALRSSGGTAKTAPAQFAAECRRGWRESAYTLGRDSGDL